MKHIRKLNSTLFDAAGAAYFVLGIYILIICPVIIGLIVWAVKLIKRAKEKARIAKANEERQARD